MCLCCFAGGNNFFICCINTDIDIKNCEKPYIPSTEAKKGKVEFKDVSFKYSVDTSGDNILDHITFTANPGEIIGIVGGTGCGKSSLVNLIPRLYDVTEGSVLLVESSRIRILGFFIIALAIHSLCF